MRIRSQDFEFPCSLVAAFGGSSATLHRNADTPSAIAKDKHETMSDRLRDTSDVLRLADLSPISVVPIRR